MKQKTTTGSELPKGRHSSLILGPSKAGKTTFARWLFEKPIWWPWDPEGVISVRPTLKEELILWVSRKDPKEHLYRALDTMIPKLIEEHKPDGIVIDDLTHMSRLLTKQAANWSYDMAQIQHYGKSIAWMRDAMEKLKFDFLELNIAYIATDAYMQQEADQTFICVPNVFGKDTFAPEIPAMVSNVFYCKPAHKSKKKGIARDYSVLTVADGLRLAGNRMNVAGDTLVLDAEIDTTIWRDGEILINPVKDRIKRILEGR